jgi:hypothetical protein
VGRHHWAQVRLFMLDPIKDIVRLSGLPDPALHVILGLVIFFVAAAILRVPVSNWKPWLVVLGLQLVNEGADLLREVIEGGTVFLRGSLIDTAVTLLLPTLIVLAGKLRRKVQRGPT